MGCSEYGGYKRPEVDIVLRLFHVLRMVELSEEHPLGSGLASMRIVVQSDYVSEIKAAEFYYNYFVPHNKG